MQILIVENNPADARLTLEALMEAGMKDTVVTLPDGDEALAYLRREGQHSTQPAPHLIFLDLHLPKTPGLTIIRELKNDPKLRSIPVIVISGTDDPREIHEAYDLHANCVVHKASDLDRFLYFIGSCYEFWGSIATLPASSRA